MTIQEALFYGRSHLSATSPTPALDARLLLQFVLEQPHTYLVSHRERPLSPTQVKQYRLLLTQAQQSEPVPPQDFMTDGRWDSYLDESTTVGSQTVR
ncbi:MAG: hypothetical protein R6X32_19615 [Chloroflexota bacterium]